MYLSFISTAKIPVKARSSYFEGGDFISWSKPIEDFKSVDLTLGYETDDLVIDSSMSADEIIEAIKDAEWQTNFADSDLENALWEVCQRHLDPDELCADWDEDTASGHDGFVLIELSDEVSYSNPEWDHCEELPGEVISALDSIGKDIVRDIEFGSDGFEGQFFYDSSMEDLYVGAPQDNDWESRKVEPYSQR